MMQRTSPDRPIAVPPKDAEFFRSDDDLAEWLALSGEDAIDPARPIIDAHHHLWDDGRGTYDANTMLDDMAEGHNIEATVYIEAVSHYREGGPQAMRVLGEIDYARGVAEAAEQQPGAPRLCAAIVGHVDLTLGDAARSVIEAAIDCGGDRFRGIRHISAWAADIPGSHRRPPIPPGLLMTDGFRAGFGALAEYGLSFDAWLYEAQLGDLLALVRAYPDSVVVVDHLGDPPVGADAERFGQWRDALGRLAQCPNVHIKLGGLGMARSGSDFRFDDRPAGSDELAAAWRPYIETCVEIFGPARAMFESNFPVDRQSCDYTTVWNAFKKITQTYSASEKDALFRGVARRVYRIGQADLAGKTR